MAMVQLIWREQRGPTLEVDRNLSALAFAVVVPGGVVPVPLTAMQKE